ncbi:MAG: hypothetical protein F4X12_13065 [Acidobacteriia bacterium]|nr:hypothetical protein [Terriglobia bacterium]
MNLLLQNQVSTEVFLGSESARILRILTDGGRLGIHVAAWTTDETVPTVSHSSSLAFGLNEAHPEQGWDFVDWDGTVLVEDNHCLVMPSNTTPSSLWRYIRLLLGNTDPALAQFSEYAVANVNALEALNGSKIKRIRFPVKTYRETTSESRGSFSDPFLNRLLGQDLTSHASILNAANITTEVSIRVNSRRAGLDGEDLVPFCSELLESDSDGVVIETRNGRVTSSELALKKAVRIPAVSKTVDPSKALSAMRSYFDELQQTGALER